MLEQKKRTNEGGGAGGILLGGHDLEILEIFIALEILDVSFKPHGERKEFPLLSSTGGRLLDDMETIVSLAKKLLVLKGLI